METEKYVEPMYHIRLTPHQWFALVNILTEYTLSKDSTKEWVDVHNDAIVTIEELLGLVTSAEVVM